MFNVGDYIVYPMHGAGTIDAIEEKDILGKVVLINRNNIWYGVEKNGDYERIKSMLKLIKNKR